MRVTVDASVAVKWLVTEDYREEARLVLGPRIERYAPDLLPVECASAIWKKARRGEVGHSAPFLDEITKLREVVRIQSSEDLLRDAAETALRIGHPVYDSLYIACAKLTGSVLVTADRRLGQIVSDRVSDIEAITLHDGPAMARVEAAGIRLVIDRDTVRELSEAWMRVASELAETSPTYLKLVKAIEALSADERMDLLVLGWVGDGRPHTRRRLFDLAMRHVSNSRYIAGLGMRWRDGLRRWSTWDRTLPASRG